MNMHSTISDGSPRLGQGVYTVPDVARILSIPLSNSRRWVSGYWRTDPGGQRHHQAGVIDRGIWGTGREKTLNFLALVEVFTFAALRNLGVSAQRIRAARQELSERFNTPFPFASHSLLSDGRQVLAVLKDVQEPVLLILSDHGQTALLKVIEPFCKKIDFCDSTSLAQAVWPLGKSHSVVVDPHHGFGRPTISGTNIATESIAQMVLAGEPRRLVSEMYDIPEAAVRDAVDFEHRIAA